MAKRWARGHDRCVSPNCKTPASPHWGRGLCRECFLEVDRLARATKKPKPWARAWTRCRWCRSKKIPHKGNGYCVNCIKLPKWARKHTRCVACNTRDFPHKGKGYCSRCYWVYVDDRPARLAQMSNRYWNDPEAQARHKQTAKAHYLRSDYDTILQRNRKWRKKNRAADLAAKQRYNHKKAYGFCEGMRVELSGIEGTAVLIENSRKVDGERIVDIRLDRTGVVLRDTPLAGLRATGERVKVKRARGRKNVMGDDAN